VAATNVAVSADEVAFLTELFATECIVGERYEAFLNTAAKDMGAQCITATSIDVEHLEEDARRDLLAKYVLRPSLDSSVSPTRRKCVSLPSDCCGDALGGVHGDRVPRVTCSRT
jgi:hypothetical protein